MSQAVLDGVRDLLPTFRERADEAERLRVVPGGVDQGARGDRVLPAPPAQAVRRPRVRPDRLLHRRARHRRRVRLHGLGLQRRRRAPLAGRRSSPTRRSRRSGAATPRTRLSSSYAPTGKAAQADGRLHAVGEVELLQRLRPLLVGAARRAGLQRRGPGRRLPHVHGAARATTRSSTSGTWSACAAPAPTTSSSTTCSCPRRSRSR